MATISGYPVRASVALTDRIFIASGSNDAIDSATVAQILDAGIPAAGLVLSNGESLTTAILGSGLSLNAGTLTASGGTGSSSYLGPILGLNRPLVRPALSAMTVLTPSPSSSFPNTITETTPGPITMSTPPTGGNYDICALCIAPPTSGSWSYDMLIETLSIDTGPSIYMEDAAGKGYVIYFYSGSSWYGQIATSRSAFSSNFASYGNVSPPQTLWYRVEFDSAAQAINVSASANRIVFNNFGPPLPLSAGLIGEPVWVGMGCLNQGPFGSVQSLWNLSPS